MQTRSRAAQSSNAFDVSAEYDDDAMSSVSFRQNRGRGGNFRGRSRGGAGRGGGFRDSHPQGSQGKAPGPATFNVSLSGNAGKEHVQLPSSTTAVNISNLRQRPRMPEAEVRIPEQPTQPPSERFRSRFAMTNLRTGRDALSSANVCMPLRSSVDMVSDPACRTACQPLHEYVTASGEAAVTSVDTAASSTVHNVTVDEIPHSYCDATCH